MTRDSDPPFDPRAILGAMQRHDVACVVIGGLARVVRGTGETTTGVDICPSLKPANLLCLDAALQEMTAIRQDGETLMPERIAEEPIVSLRTAFGTVNVIAAPAGVPRGYDALKSGASGEHLGHGLKPDVASTGDLIAMTAALRRPEDLARLPALRRILELEAAPSQLVTPRPGAAASAAPTLKPGDADRMSKPARTGAPSPARGIER